MWSYSPDLEADFWGIVTAPCAGYSRRHALEVTMCTWMPTTFTGDERYLPGSRAHRFGHRSGTSTARGWNYIHDFAGEASLQKW